MKTEALFTCPRCTIPNFSAGGLHRHNCKGPGRDYERRRLTLLEIAQAQPSAPLADRALNAQPSTLSSPGGVS